MSNRQAVVESPDPMEFPDLQPAESFFSQKQRIADLEREIAKYKTREWDENTQLHVEGLEAELLEEKVRLQQIRSTLVQQLRSRQEAFGRIEVIYGCMFSGKTDELIDRIEEARHSGYKVHVFKHSFDTRYGRDKIVAHNGLSENATPVARASDILEHLDYDTRVVAIDEAQFFPGSESPSLVAICENLAEIDVRVIVGGLNLDFRGEPFGLMPRLMAIADSTTQKTTECPICAKRRATRTQRLINGSPASYHSPLVLVGAAAVYQPRCRQCHEVPDKPATKLGE